MKLIMNHTTGRSGTAFLSQAFGHDAFQKRKVHQIENGSVIITHESWNNLPIHLLKNTKDLGSTEAVSIVNSYITNKVREIREQYPNVEKYFVTDHRVGIYLAPSMPLLPFDYQIIRTKRNHDDVAKSLLKKIDHKKGELSDSRFEKFYQQLWKANLFSADDKFIINKVCSADWDRMGLYDKCFWYSIEVEEQWKKLKNMLPIDNYIEISFEEIITTTGLNKIKDFTGIPWSDKWSTIKANE